MTQQAEIRERISSVADILVRRGVATENTVRGCTAAEIEQIAADAGHPLPAAYRGFLATLGRGAGRFYVGTDIFYPSVLGLTDAARNLVGEDEAGLRLPEDAIVFIMHQGYQFMFIRATEGDDPPVYYYMEQSGVFERKADKLTDFLCDVASDPW